ncbi:unnamed protein product [Paramecium sonneborni]|uniref:Uncharacterized protein n=1 Tax=Paramecium sonneborni TaxID=65129 RepID=A0A8S1P6B7_9CILI|nr:unnamed protein product [Paramecium sonneborni]
MDSSPPTVKTYLLVKNQQINFKENTKILSSKINFEDPTALYKTRNLLANMIKGNFQFQSNVKSKQ